MVSQLKDVVMSKERPQVPKAPPAPLPHPNTHLWPASARSSNFSPSSRPPLGCCLVKHTAAACFAEWVWAVEDDRRPMNKTQTCLFCAVLSKWCISNEVFAVSRFCLLINETFLLPVLFLAREVTGKCEEKAVNWAGLGSVCFMMVLI